MEHSKNDTYKILLDENWSLEDLTEFLRLYFQNYSFVYCLETSNTNEVQVNLTAILHDYELREGLSYVNIYEVFKRVIPGVDKPKIKSMKYNSPGWFELALDIKTALAVAGAISIFLKSASEVTTAYKKLYKIYSDLSKMRAKKKNDLLKLDIENAKLANELNKELAKGLNFKSLKQLEAQTKDVEETSKFLMAHFRRLFKLSNFVRKGKASFPLEKEE